MGIRFEFDGIACSACGACSIACMDQNDIDVESGQAPYRRVRLIEREKDHLYLSEACRHCPDAPCIAACRFHCIWKDPETGLTLYDNAKCVGCRACARKCPYDAVTFRPTGLARPKVRMEKCNGCIERVRAGLQPACVQACPTGALRCIQEQASPDPNS